MRIAIAASMALLAACAENRGMTQVRPDARPFAEAHSQCWEVAMNIGGYSQTMAQQRAYDACLARNGWTDLRSVL